MRRLFVLVEGETEERFVNEVLASYLGANGFSSISAKLLGNARQRSRRGGIRPWVAARSDIILHLRQDPQVLLTTMVDYYGLPKGKSERAWPGRIDADALPFAERPQLVEGAIHDAIKDMVGSAADRFVPFVVMHEFEGLLFSDCSTFAKSIGRPDVRAKLQSIRDAFESPEHINDSPETHPAQRVMLLMPEYQKPLHGTRAASQIGLDSICSACAHFRRWLERLAEPV